MAWSYNKEDLRRLSQAHPALQLVFMEYQKISPLPLRINEVARSIEAQRANIKKGVSWTMRSRHLPSKDGKTRAVDAAPLGPDGKMSWSWPLYFKTAPWVRKAAMNVKVPLEWGAIWDREISKVTGNLEAEVANYVKRQRAKKRKANIDGPHWQLPWKEYP